MEKNGEEGVIINNNIEVRKIYKKEEGSNSSSSSGRGKIM